MQEVRCEKCGKLLLKVNANIQQDSQIEIEIKCPHRVTKYGKNSPCKAINKITF